MLDLALSYSPPGTDLSVTLAVVRDPNLLAQALKIAIKEAESGALEAGNVISARGLKTKAMYLRGCLKELAGSAADTASPNIREVLM